MAKLTAEEMAKFKATSEMTKEINALHAAGQHEAARAIEAKRTEIDPSYGPRKVRDPEDRRARDGRSY